MIGPKSAMRKLSSKGDLSAFFERLPRARERLLMLDYDGTIAPFSARRDEATPDPAVLDVLDEILRLANTRTVIVSGRSLSDLLPLLDFSPLPEIWGSHGWERLVPGKEPVARTLDPAASNALRAAAEAVEALREPNLVEVKTFGVATHWRGRPAADVERLHRLILERWSPIVTGSLLEIHPFDGGLELRVRGRDKGSVVAELLSEMGRGLAAAYLGDDLTDEDAFEALGDRGLSVLVRAEYRPTLADVWMTPPEELVMFLRRWRDACSGVGAVAARA
jgi:trehalose-phosphatase